MKEKGLYDDTFYKTSIGNIENLSKLQLSEHVDEKSIQISLHPVMDNPEEYTISYITDLHLDHKVIRRFPDGATKIQIQHYFDELTDKMLEEYDMLNFKHFLLIGGDVSYSIELYKLFYSSLFDKIAYNHVITVLGNHEIWNHENYEVAVKEYCSLHESNSSVLLENALFVMKKGKRYVIDEKELLSATDEEIREFCNQSRLTILGGIGFSGLNDEFNIDSGIYRETIKDRTEEKNLSSRFDQLHEKLKRILGDKNLIVLTHMPIKDWNTSDVCPNWYYVNGHTHRNLYEFDERLRLFADNQMGYNNKFLSLKQFQINRMFDIFKDRPDGIHTITRNEYIDFNHGLGIRLDFNRSGTIHMLKKDGYYMFILESDKGRLSLLKGGALNRLKVQKLDYYLEKIEQYGKILKKSLKNYSDSLHTLSEKIKEFGATGKIHGCIIDIDFFNHLYINPYDGTITPYHANDMIDKTVYPNLKNLLKDHNNELFIKYMNLIESDSEKAQALTVKNEIKRKKKYTETDIYRYSNLMLNYQCAIDKHVIRIWNESIFNIDLENNNPMLLIDIINSGEME